MDKKGSASSHISKSLSLIEKQEKEYQSIIGDSASLKDHILSLKLGLPFLRELLNLSTNEDLKMRIKREVFSVGNELHSLSSRATDGNLILEFDGAYASLRKRINSVVMVKPETKEYHVLFPKFFSWTGYFKKTNDFLLKSFEDLLSCKADLLANLLEEIEDIQETLKLLQALFTYVADTEVHITGETKEHLATVITLLDKAALLLYSCLVEEMDEAVTLAMKRKLSDLQLRINVNEIYMDVLRASELYASPKDPLERGCYLLDNLIRLLNSNAISFIYPSAQSVELHEKLKLLRDFLTDLPHEQKVEKFNYLVSTIEAISWKSIPILCSCYDEDIKGDIAKEVDGALSEVLHQIKEIQAEVEEMKLYDYPKTDELGFLDLFLGHLEDLSKFRPDLRDQIETLREGFGFLRSFLRTIKEQRNEHKELEDLWSRIIGLAYLAEYVIDLYLVKDTPDSRIMLSISNIIEQAKLIKFEVTRIYDGQSYYIQALPADANKTLRSVPSQASVSTADEVVGFEDEAKKIMEFLVEGTKQLDVISIVGMPGQGKTTVAKKMYECPSIIKRFHVRAWCSVSQTYQKRELLLTILGDVIGNIDGIKMLNDKQLAEKLYQSLKERRYLIVIDDIWNIEAWNDLVRSFPDDKNYSRILITSRLQIVDPQTQAGSKVHHLRAFTEVESWKLLQMKLFQKESFSEDFLQVGKQIAQKCEGLPLAIVVIGGLLAKVEKDIQKWKQIEESLSSHILSDSEDRCMAILELSYNHLPDHLKPCFLYIGAFPEDKEIPVWKLKWLWIAEGFVRDTEEKNLEYVAEGYFMDLISRSLIRATKERSGGGVKACRLHDLLRDFCLKTGEKESFLQMIHGDNWPKSFTVCDQRRLSIYPNMDGFTKAKPFGYSIRSLLHIADKYYYYPKHIFPIISQNFKLLRVLDTACETTDESSFNAILLLIHLRYLAVGVRTTSIPSSIANLWSLQSLLINANYSFHKQVTDVPDCLWDMANLRHVHINHGAFFNVHDRRLGNSPLLDNLETLSTPCLSYGEEAEKLLRRLPKLRKLRCIFLDSWDDSTKCYQFPVLDFLDQLKSLKIFFQASSHWGKKCNFSFPINLEKLTLLNFKLLWDDISQIGRRLPNLKVLKLTGSDCNEKWNVNDGDFQKLTCLKLSSMKYIEEWIASEDSFPILEQLVLDNCENLKEVPPCFGGIPTLQMIAVRDCKPSVNDSARKVQMEQQEMQNEVKVHIHVRKVKL